MKITLLLITGTLIISILWRMSNYDYKTLQSIREADQLATNNDTLLSNTVEFNETDSLEHNRTIDVYNPPTKETIKSILLEESQKIPNSTSNASQKQKESILLRLIDSCAHNGSPQKCTQSSNATIDDYATVYELVYTLIASFTRHDIPIFVGFGSHLGARRHHGIIPFGEKDVDLQVFSTDEVLVKSIINDTVSNNTNWNDGVIGDKEFGYNLLHASLFYIDFWLFDYIGPNNNNNADQIQCIGRKIPGCSKWYKTFHLKTPPIFKKSDFFPPIYEIFGTHYVPIPNTSKELETFQYSSEHWNTTCGPHRRWANEKALGLGNKTKDGWIKIPRRERNCEILYDLYPFVFKKDEDGNEEELRQGGTIIHQSRLSQSLNNNSSLHKL